MRRSAITVAVTVALVAGCGAPGSPPPPSTVTTSPSPTATAAPADFMTKVNVINELETFPGLTHWDPKQASLVGPGLTFGFDAMATTATLTEVQSPLWRTPIVAAEDYEFLCLNLATPPELPGGGTVFSAERTNAKVTIVAGDHRIDVPPSSLVLGLLVFSVPVGAPTTVVLEDAGRSQSLDLRSGRRGEDAIDGYYPVARLRSTQDLRAQGRVSGVYSEDFLLPFETTQVSARLLPYYGTGWARPGRAWLVVSLTWRIEHFYKTTLDVDRSFTVNRLRPPAGEVVLPGRPISGLPGEPMISFAVEVPATLTTATLNFTPQGTVSIPDRDSGRLTAYVGSRVTLQLAK